MPLYDYRCTKCGNTTEIRHGFNDTYNEPCAKCGGEVKRVIGAAPIVFKGSGFYITDSRPASAGDKSSSPSSGEKSSPSSESAA